MLVDHIGLFFFPQFGVMRIIGRLSFPLFAWFVANGARYTRDPKKYLVRMIIFAMVSQVPFALANDLVYSNFHLFNAVFTLSIGLAGIMFIQKTDNKFTWGVIAIGAFLFAELFGSDYGGAGVLSVIFFYIFFDKIQWMVLSQILIYGLLVTYPAVNDVMIHSVNPNNFVSLWEIFGLFSLIFIAVYNKERGPKIKYIFYAIYPLQYVIFYLLLISGAK
jgi:hypothetical protein